MHEAFAGAALMTTCI